MVCLAVMLCPLSTAVKVYVYYPTHRTEDEKRERRNALARKARAKKKEA